MPKILLLTAESLSHEDHETALLATEFQTLGVDSSFIAWTDPAVHRIDADLALIRSTWDYTTRLQDFLQFLTELPVPVRNPVEVVRWNCHKGYLTELATSGAPVVPTVLFRSGVEPELPDFGTAEVIVKPASSAGARGVGRFASSSEAGVDHLRSLLAGGDALVQPFLPGVADGERSLVFLGGNYSHAVRKTPAAGDFRVQEQYGGVIVPHVCSPAELAAAQAALAVVPGGAGTGQGEPLLYARIDLIGPADAPLIMELELIEPELFLPQAPGSAAVLARAVVALL